MRALALTGILLFLPASARAVDSHPFERVPHGPPAESDPAENLEPREEPRRPYYGWQNIVVGYTGALLAVHGFVSDSPMLMITGAATFGLGGTIVHAAHGNVTGAAVSPLIMVGAPVVLGAAATYAESEGVAIFTALYLLGAPLIDGALGREPAPARQTVALTPSLRRDAVGLSFTGAF